MVRCLEPSTGIFMYLNTNEERIKSIVSFSLLSLVLLFLSRTCLLYQAFAFSAESGTVNESPRLNFLQTWGGCPEEAHVTLLAFPAAISPIFQGTFRAFPNFICWPRLWSVAVCKPHPPHNEEMKETS